jgi:putative endonuclease
MTEKAETGKSGEEKAVEYLKKLGYQILEVNWRSGKYEIDIIATHDDCLVIVEVKTRHSTLMGEPEMAVDKQKQRSLIFAANKYIWLKHITQDTRFDIISVVMNGGEARLHHIPDAFYPTMR